MSDRSGSGHKIAEWLLEATRFSVSIAVYLLIDRLYVGMTGEEKPGGLVGEALSIVIIALLSGLAAIVILQFIFGRPCLVISWSLNSWDNPSRYPVIDFVTSTDRGVKLEVAYRGGSALSGIVALFAWGSEVQCRVALAPPNRVTYTGQVVFSEATVSNHGVLFKLPGLKEGPPYGCEISLGRAAVSQVPINLDCRTDVASAQWWRGVIYRLIKIETNVDGFSVRST